MSHSDVTAANNLLDRLDGLKQTAPGRWIAKCPAHEDANPSLSVRELDDGRLLIHCFAGCSAPDVLAAVGLTLADLFPDGGKVYAPGGRHRPRVPAGDLLLMAAREAWVVSLIAADMLAKRAVDTAAWPRLAKATQRLGRMAAEVQP